MDILIGGLPVTVIPGVVMFMLGLIVMGFYLGVEAEKGFMFIGMPMAGTGLAAMVFCPGMMFGFWVAVGLWVLNGVLFIYSMRYLRKTGQLL